MEPTILTFGPYRLIGLSYQGKNEHGEIPRVWDTPVTGFIARMGEVLSPPDATYGDTGQHAAFGVCRCLPGVTDGSFEYIAATPARADAPIPPGMVEVQIPEATYAAFEVQGLEGLPAAFGAAHQWLQSQTDWLTFCSSPEGECDCGNHPCFELYPPDFSTTMRLYIYFPIRKAPSA